MNNLISHFMLGATDFKFVFGAVSVGPNLWKINSPWNTSLLQLGRAPWSASDASPMRKVCMFCSVSIHGLSGNIVSCDRKTWIQCAARFLMFLTVIAESGIFAVVYQSADSQESGESQFSSLLSADSAETRGPTARPSFSNSGIRLQKRHDPAPAGGEVSPRCRQKTGGPMEVTHPNLAILPPYRADLEVEVKRPEDRPKVDL
ncbi:hypothetical protein EG329_004351 [Mollisiaceae sp. DMI_Dod_QoI]|nr:hypothetical protein EG329_004351 [Helotiales sp. DMI_Dod_QoI]